MNKSMLLVAAVAAFCISASVLDAKIFRTVKEIRSAGTTSAGQNAELRLKPKSIIVTNGVFSLVDADGNTVVLRVPRGMEKKVKGLSTDKFYTFMVKIESAAGAVLNGYILTFGD